jgi:hypothetical protein
VRGVRPLAGDVLGDDDQRRVPLRLLGQTRQRAAPLVETVAVEVKHLPALANLDLSSRDFPQKAHTAAVIMMGFCSVAPRETIGPCADPQSHYQPVESANCINVVIAPNVSASPTPSTRADRPPVSVTHLY